MGFFYQIIGVVHCLPNYNILGHANLSIYPKNEIIWEGYAMNKDFCHVSVF